MEFKEQMIDDKLIMKSNSDTASIGNAKDFKDIVFERIDNGKNKIIVDLSDVPLIDSTFLGALVITHRKAASQGGGLRLIGMNESIITLIGLTKLENIFPNYSSIEDAINSF